MKSLLHTIIIAALLGAALAPAGAAPERPLLLALNPQPEPPGKQTDQAQVYIKQDELAAAAQDAEAEAGRGHAG